MLRNVAVACAGPVAAFELGVLCEVFGVDRTADGLPGYDFAVCRCQDEPLVTSSGFGLVTEHGVERLARADLVAVPGWHDLDDAPPPALLDGLRAAVERGARVMSVCSGAFVLAAAGLLDGRRATTHWRMADLLARRYPGVDVDPDVLYVEDGPILTSAGTAAGIDLCLHLVRTEHGTAVANALARRMVVPPHRDGGQAQFVETPVRIHRPGDELSRVLDWAAAHLDRDLSIEELASRAHMSTRTFARRFVAVAGTTPHSWLVGQRIALAERLLEDGDAGIEEVAMRSGFGSAATLRQHFARVRGTSPLLYRRAFRARRAAG